MTQWHQYTPHEQKLTEALFVARALLNKGSEHKSPTPLTSFTALYQQATQPDHP